MGRHRGGQRCRCGDLQCGFQCEVLVRGGTPAASNGSRRQRSARAPAAPTAVQKTVFSNVGPQRLTCADQAASSSAERPDGATSTTQAHQSSLGRQCHALLHLWKLHGCIF